jgi:THO complex subunit 1
MDFSARYILIKSPSSSSSSSEEGQPDESKTKELFDTVIVYEDDVEKTASRIAEYIYAKAEETNGDDANMADAPAVDGDGDGDGGTES